MEVKNNECIYVLQKGEERVSMADHNSLLALAGALMVLGCTELLSQKEIKGHKQTDSTYEIAFLDKHIEVVGLTDVEKVIHWVLTAGCKKVSVEMVPGEEK